jgi:hypothetical protein
MTVVDSPVVASGQTLVCLMRVSASSRVVNPWVQSGRRLFACRFRGCHSAVVAWDLHDVILHRQSHACEHYRRALAKSKLFMFVSPGCAPKPPSARERPEVVQWGEPDIRALCSSGDLEWCGLLFAGRPAFNR